MRRMRASAEAPNGPMHLCDRACALCRPPALFTGPQQRKTAPRPMGRNRKQGDWKREAGGRACLEGKKPTTRRTPPQVWHSASAKIVRSEPANSTGQLKADGARGEKRGHGLIFQPPTDRLPFRLPLACRDAGSVAPAADHGRKLV